MAAVIKAFSGLYTTGNYIGSVPEGAMAVARNIVLKAANVAASRRGQFTLPSAFGNPGDLGNALIAYGDTLLVQHGVSGLSRYSATADTFTAYSSAAPSDGGPTLADVHAPAGNRLRGVEAANNVYLSGAKGVRRIDTVTGNTSRSAGAPPAPDGSASGLGLTGIIAPGFSVSYRSVFGNLDADGTLRLGAPSGRMVVANPSAATLSFNGYVAISVPEGAYPGDIVRLYRTEIISGTEPGDEHFLVYEGTVPSFAGCLAGSIVPVSGGWRVTPSGGTHSFVAGQYVHTYQSYTPSGTGTELEAGTYFVNAVTASTFDITSHSGTTGTVTNGVSFTFYARTVPYTDSTPDSFLSNDPLYTNPNTGDGPLAANYEPPIAKDLELFNTRLFGANVIDRRTRTVQLLGVGSPSGIQVNDTFTIGTSTWTFLSSFSSLPGWQPDRYVDVQSSGTPAQNVELTARELVKSINLTAESPVFAFYVSGVNDAPGRILLREKNPDPSQSALTVSSSRSSAWAFLGKFDPNSAINGLAYSEPDQPEAFTVVGYLPVAAENDDIRRIKRLRENIYVFKRRGGTFVVPQSEPFKVSEFDSTCRIVADDTIVLLDNKIWALTEQGLVSLSESGVQITGWPIDVDVKALFRDLARLNRLAFAVAYQTEFTLELWLPSATDTAETAGKSYWYNVQTNAWTEQPLARRFGLVTPLSDVAYYCSSTANSLVKERKSRDFTDYADETLSVTISTASGTSATLSSAAGLSTGDLLSQGVYTARIDAISGNVLTLNTSVPLSPGAASVLKAIECEIQPLPVTLGQPGESKQIAEVVYSFRPGLSVESPTALIRTDEDPTTLEYLMPYTMGTGYGSGAYGDDSYGGRGLKAVRRASLGTAGNEFTPGIRIREARTLWELQAITVEVNDESQRAAP